MNGSATSPRVTWRRSADNVGTSGYRVLRNGVPLSTTAATTFVDRQATPGQSYVYAVQAFDSAGNVSAPGTVTQRAAAVAPRRLRELFRGDDATRFETSTGPVVCGRLGTARDERVGCRVRTLDGWRTVRAGREVPWGAPATRRFLEDDHGRVWFCRVASDKPSCVPFDLTTVSWGFDRRGARHDAPTYGTWLMTDRGPARCGTAGDRATCSVVTSDGWRSPRQARGARAGDPLSRAFVQTAEGVSFCRVVDGRAACSDAHRSSPRLAADGRRRARQGPGPLVGDPPRSRPVRGRRASVHRGRAAPRLTPHHPRPAS